VVFFAGAPKKVPCGTFGRDRKGSPLFLGNSDFQKIGNLHCASRARSPCWGHQKRKAPTRLVLFFFGETQGCKLLCIRQGTKDFSMMSLWIRKVPASVVEIPAGGYLQKYFLSSSLVLRMFFGDVA
jgi:hypothetical protein